MLRVDRVTLDGRANSDSQRCSSPAEGRMNIALQYLFFRFHVIGTGGKGRFEFRQLEWLGEYHRFVGGLADHDGCPSEGQVGGKASDIDYLPFAGGSTMVSLSRHACGKIRVMARCSTDIAEGCTQSRWTGKGGNGRCRRSFLTTRPAGAHVARRSSRAPLRRCISARDSAPPRASFSRAVVSRHSSRCSFISSIAGTDGRRDFACISETARPTPLWVTFMIASFHYPNAAHEGAGLNCSATKSPLLPQ